MEKPYITGAVRTPIGAFNGSLSQITAVRLGTIAIEGAVKRSALRPQDIDCVIMGNVLSTGLGPSPSKQAATGAGLPDGVRAFSVNRGRASGMEAVALAAHIIAAGEAEIAIAGGMENMSRAPYLLERARFGYRLGGGEAVDPVVRDCLKDPSGATKLFEAAEEAARRFGISRQEQDRFAWQSISRALSAQEQGAFERELIPIVIPLGRDKFASFNSDESPCSKGDMGGVPPFAEGGTVTQGNSSELADGAAACMILSARAVRNHGAVPLARISAMASTGTGFEGAATAAAGAIDELLRKAGLSKDDIGLFEINEDFSATTIAVKMMLGIDESRLNIEGGGIAFGNAIGACGARLLVSLANAMQRSGVKRGIAAVAAMNGEALAFLLERTGEFFE